MLMATNKPATVLHPISTAFSPEDRARIVSRALEIAAEIEGKYGPIYAEVIPGVEPHWHVIMVVGGQEREVAKELERRRFGIYVPEAEVTEVRRGRLVTRHPLMLPGYVLVFVWDIDRHSQRILAVPGVIGILRNVGQASIIVDREVDLIRKAENVERPLPALYEKPKRQKRWRRSNKRAQADTPTIDPRDYDVVGVHAYSPFIEAMRAEMAEERLEAFHRMLGILPL